MNSIGACGRLEIEGVSLYPGTKHSTACGLREVATPEEIKAMTLHGTGAAFHRYFMTVETIIANCPAAARNWKPPITV